MTPKRTIYIKAVNPQPLRYLLGTNQNDAIQYVNAL